jgi:hypothetical protein
MTMNLHRKAHLTTGSAPYIYIQKGSQTKQNKAPAPAPKAPDLRWLCCFLVFKFKIWRIHRPFWVLQYRHYSNPVFPYNKYRWSPHFVNFIS